MPVMDESFWRSRPTPFTDDMRAMVEDLKARGAYVPSPGERLVKQALENLVATVFRDMIRRAYPEILEAWNADQQKGFHNGGLVSNSDVKPDLGLKGGCHGHLAKRDAYNPTLPAWGNGFDRAGKGSVTVVITRDGGVE